MAFVIAVVIALGSLGVTPAAHAKGVRPTIASASGTVAPGFIGWYYSRVCCDRLQRDVVWVDGAKPTLAVAKGGVLTVTIDGASYLDVVGVTANWGPNPTSTRDFTLDVRGEQTGPRTYRWTLPADVTLPRALGLWAYVHDGWWYGWEEFGVNLVGAPASSPPPPAVVEPVPTVARKSLRLRGRRVSARVACPAGAASGCSGALTLRTPNMRVARIRFTNLPAGARRTLRVKVSARVLRHIRRHRFRTLLARVNDSAEVRLRLR
jgi:hypothetical protein